MRKGLYLLIVFLLIAILSLPQSTVFADDNALRIQGTNQTFDTLEAAIKAVNTTGGTVEVIGDVTVTQPVTITGDVKIIGAEGPHTINLSNKRLSVMKGGKLTLGDGAEQNRITIVASASVDILDGKLDFNDGVSLKSTAAQALRVLNPTTAVTISGGAIEGAQVALWIAEEGKVTEISGGEFRGSESAVHLTNAGTSLDRISGGTFLQTNPDASIHGHAIFLQDNAKIGEISGGVYESKAYSGLAIVRGGFVEKISGGEFIAPWMGIQINDSRGEKTGVGTISGGTISGLPDFGLYLRGDGAQINSITDGNFTAGIGLQNDIGGVIGEISGGAFNGTTFEGIFNAYGQIGQISGGSIVSNNEDGLLNLGTIDLISGGTFIGKQSAINSKWVYNSDVGKLTEISNGIFWGKENTAIILGSDLILEPNLSTESKGFGRYFGFEGKIFNDEALVKYPVNSEGITYMMSSETEAVAHVPGTEFKYLMIQEKETEETSELPTQHNPDIESSIQPTATTSDGGTDPINDEPQTGDNSELVLWIALAGMALFVTIYLQRTR